MKTRCLVTVLFAIIALSAGATARATDVDLTAAHWLTNPGSQPDIPVYNDANGFLYFDFQAESDETRPQWGPPPICAHFGTCYSMNYLYLPATYMPSTSIGGYLKVKVNVTASSNAVFHNETEPYGTGPHKCATVGAPPKISLLLNTFGADPRFWAEPPVTLTTGATTITVPLNAHYWNDVNGHVADDPLYNPPNQSPGLASEFYAALTNMYAIGMTFGGSCSDGHGVYITPASATARFTVEKYEILSCSDTCSCGVPTVSFDDPVCSPGVDTGLPACGTLSCTGGQHIFKRTCPCEASGCNDTWSASYCAAP